MKIYGDKRSGNCYKIELCSRLLGIDYQFMAIDILQGETQRPEFLALNPNGKIPVVELDDGRVLWESNAIINYLALGSALLPRDPYQLAQVQQWQFFEQYSHEPYIAVRRFIQKYQGMPASRLDEYHAKKSGGDKALAIMEQQFNKSLFLLGDTVTTADLSLFAYTHIAEEGGFELRLYPGVQAWLARIQALPNYYAMS
ncbi:glutathione S-transferase [Alteromonadaceae bacterium Bs31]|nr:glutathione S-transferase [Alteromonadaceae bacterium Bs31]